MSDLPLQRYFMIDAVPSDVTSVEKEKLTWINYNYNIAVIINTVHKHLGKYVKG